MTIRVASNETKISLVVAAHVVGLTAGLAVSILAGPGWGQLAIIATALATVASFTRVFRGENEAIGPPRKWWRMTAEPTSGFVMGALFGSSVVATPRLFGFDVQYVPFLVVNVIIAISFFASSIHLAMRKRSSRVETAPHSHRDEATAAVRAGDNSAMRS